MPPPASLGDVLRDVLLRHRFGKSFCIFGHEFYLWREPFHEPLWYANRDGADVNLSAGRIRCIVSPCEE